MGSTELTREELIVEHDRLCDEYVQLDDDATQESADAILHRIGLIELQLFWGM